MAERVGGGGEQHGIGREGCQRGMGIGRRVAEKGCGSAVSGARSGKEGRQRTADRCRAWQRGARGGREVQGYGREGRGGEAEGQEG